MQLSITTSGAVARPQNAVEALVLRSDYEILQAEFRKAAEIEANLAKRNIALIKEVNALKEMCRGATLAREVSELKSHLRELERTTRETVTHLQLELDAERQSRTAAELRVSALLSSTSWKITAPVRWLKKKRGGRS